MNRPRIPDLTIALGAICVALLADARTVRIVLVGIILGALVWRSLSRPASE